MMANISLPVLNMSSDQDREQSCSPENYCDFTAWRETHLTEKTRTSLVAIVSVNFIAAILTIILNALVITAVITRRQLRSNSNILLACLAGTDLMVGALVQPLMIASEIKHILGSGPYWDLDKARIVVMMLVCWASFNHLTVISIERYVAIKHALRYQDIVTKRRLLIGVLLAWVVSVVQTTPYVLLVTTGDQEHWAYLIYLYWTWAAIALVNISGIIYINAYIFSETRRQKKRLQTEHVAQEEAKRLKKENKAATTVIIISGAVLLSYLPTTVVTVLSLILEKVVELRVLYLIAAWSASLVMLGSLFNPLIYCWRLKKFRDSFRELLHLR